MAEQNFANRTLYHGDNPDFLRGMNSETVDLIATDLPFNKNKDFHATPDSLAAVRNFTTGGRGVMTVTTTCLSASSAMSQKSGRGSRLPRPSMETTWRRFFAGWACSCLRCTGSATRRSETG